MHVGLKVGTVYAQVHSAAHMHTECGSCSPCAPLPRGEGALVCIHVGGRASRHLHPATVTSSPVKCLFTQASSADEKFADYKPTTAFLFPGQGAQTVGMAKVCFADGMQMRNAAMVFLL